MDAFEKATQPIELLKTALSICIVGAAIAYFIGIVQFGVEFHIVQINGVETIFPLPVPNYPDCKVYETNARLKEIQRSGGLFGGSDPEFWFVFDGLTYRSYDKHLVLTHTPERLYRVKVCGTSSVASFEPVEGK